MKIKLDARYYPVIILLLGVLFYIPYLGHVHLFDWDEINFAESAREMVLTKNYSIVQINFKPFWEKPPLFFWMQVLSMKIFGINEFAARFPNALVGCATLLTLYFIGKKEKNAPFGLIWALIYWGSLTPHLYFKSGIIDPSFNLFIFLGIYYSICVQQHRYNAMLSGLFIGLAVLTKGPVGGLIWFLTMVSYWIIFSRSRPIYSFKQLAQFGAICLSITSIWIIMQLRVNGLWFFQEFIKYQIRLFTTPDAGHGEPFYYHFVVILLGCFPMSIFGLVQLIKKNRDDLTRWMKILFWVVMILFSLSTTKIVHYSSMAYFPLSFLAASIIYEWIFNGLNIPSWIKVLFISIGSVLSLAILAIPIVGLYATKLIPYIHDQFAAKNLEAQVSWSGLESAIGVFYLISIIVCGVYLLKNIFPARAFMIMTSSTALLLMMTSIFIVPRIERYSQGAAIDFYRARAGEDAYIDVVGFKSYAPYFYFKKPMDVNSKMHDSDWLLNGKVDKTVYLVSKIDRMEEFRNHPNLEILYEKNGFVFMKRK
jgi:4-amino-4-deoxy-L-arabinose transferase-like glycosyltransferase